MLLAIAFPGKRSAAAVVTDAKTRHFCCSAVVTSLHSGDHLARYVCGKLVWIATVPENNSPEAPGCRLHFSYSRPLLLDYQRIVVEEDLALAFISPARALTAFYVFARGAFACVLRLSWARIRDPDSSHVFRK